MQPPILETPRLSLRAHTLADLDACAALWGDPDVVRYIGNRLSTREDAWARMLRYRGHWELLGFGFWAIVERATGAFVGECGLAEFKREVAEPLGVEAGWALLPGAQGKGYATEAMRAALVWGAAHVATREVSALIDPGNAPSLAVAHKCGFVEVARTTYKGDECVVLRARLDGGKPRETPRRQKT
jgi:RimJ/RimL family protein N-acetyltransferase